MSSLYKPLTTFLFTVHMVVNADVNQPTHPLMTSFPSERFYFKESLTYLSGPFLKGISVTFTSFRGFFVAGPRLLAFTGVNLQKFHFHFIFMIFVQV